MSASDIVSETGSAVSNSSDAAMIRFPGLGIEIHNMNSGFDIFGFHVAWYGVIIAVGIVISAIIVYNLAKRTGQRADDYIDLIIISMILAIVGARLYYVAFSWDYYSLHPDEIIQIRNGGLAVYGGLIFGVAAAAVVCKIKKISFLRVLDTAAPGIVLGQAIGRWGNFTNMEAYGGYSENFLRMQIRLDAANGTVNEELLNNLVNIDGVNYIQVHPTFLYESIWCLLVFIAIMVFRKKARYRGEVICWYIGGYALGRVWIESLRTDSLMIGHTGIAVSQLLAFVLFIAALAVLIVNRILMIKDKTRHPDHIYETVPHWRELKYDKEKRVMYYPGDMPEEEDPSPKP